MASKEKCHDEQHTKRLLEDHFQYTLDHIQALQAFSGGRIRGLYASQAFHADHFASLY